MLEFNRNGGTTFVIATHDLMVIEHADKIIKIKDGKIVNNLNKDQYDRAFNLRQFEGQVVALIASDKDGKAQNV